jgi:hypothetical protein
MSTYTNTTPPRNATSTRICMDMIWLYVWKWKI